MSVPRKLDKSRKKVDEQVKSVAGGEQKKGENKWKRLWKKAKGELENRKEISKR